MWCFALAALSTLAMLSLPITQVQCTAPYIAADMGTLGGDSTYAHGINQHGEVVATYETPGGQEHAFFWNGAMAELGTLVGQQSSAHDINDLGQGVGAVDATRTVHTAGCLTRRHRPWYFHLTNRSAPW